MIDAERMLGSLVRSAMSGDKRRGRKRRRRRGGGHLGASLLGGAGKGALAMGALGVAMAAFEHLELIREDPRNAECMIDNTEYLRCEIARTGRREMITKLEDFLRRRSPIRLVVRHEDYAYSDGLKEACRVLFGDEADAKLAEYLDSVALHRRDDDAADG